LAELNNKIFSFLWTDDKEHLHILSGDNIDVEQVFYTGPPPSLVPHRPPQIPPLSTLVTGIINIKSPDKLFLSHTLLLEIKPLVNGD
jgi:hypothetical protein